ncbi:glucan binding protein-2 [Gorgonomyces haynaldii]|nr:glucan binding protein-2 [Gorgonomyces haynaldii]
MLFFQAVAAQNYCLSFQDDFNTLDTSVWTHDVTLGGGGNWEFEWYTNNRTNSFVENGVLYLKPTFTSDNIGADKVLNGYTMDINAQGCNQPGFYGCSRSSNGANIINPIQSALLRSVNSHTLKFGKVEVRARVPKGDWIWPAIWMLPKYSQYGSWPASGEIDIMEARGNAPNSFPGNEGYDTMGSTLHWGPNFYSNKWQQTHKTYKLPSGTFADDFHTFGLIWNNKTLTTYVDDPSNVVLSVPLDNFYKKGNFVQGKDQNPWAAASDAAPFDQEFYLIMNVAVGGTSGYFPNGAPVKPWNDQSNVAALEFWNNRNLWQNTWPQDNTRALAIDSVKMWNEC